MTVLRHSYLWQHSGGLNHFRGSWLCHGLGRVTWHPPVYAGSRELRLYGGCGSVTSALNLAALILTDTNGDWLHLGGKGPITAALIAFVIIG